MRKHYGLLAKWYGKSFFRRVRHSFVPLLSGSSLLFSTNCGLSTSDLRWSHPSTPIYQICDKPLDVPEGIDLWGFDELTKTLVTAEDPAELRMFDSATAFFEYNADASASSASRMPSEYGLTCVKRPISFPDASASSLPPSSELFRSKGPCPAKVADTVGRADPSLLAAPAQGKAPCDPVKKAPKRLYVCVRSEGVPNDAGEWTNGGVVKGNLWLSSGPEYAEAVKVADRIYVFDAKAIPESVWHFGKDTKLRCPGRAPIPYDQTMASGMLQGMDTVSDLAAASNAGEPKKGDGKTTDTSGPDGKGPPLNFLESLSRNLQYVAALSSGDTSGDPKDPNGSRSGILSGKNVGGPDLLILQAAAGVFAIVRIPFNSGKEFIDKVRTALTGGKVTGILDPKVLSKEMAELLAKEPEEKVLRDALEALKKKGDTKPLEAMESFGKAMAISLQEAGVILPYSRAQIFTRGWGGKYQAHHAVEVAMGRDILKMEKEAIDNIPAIILTDAEHTAFTNALAKARANFRKNIGREIKEPHELWAIYKEVYAGKPAWLEAIKGYFPNIP